MRKAATDLREDRMTKVRRVYLQFLFFNASFANVVAALVYLFAFQRASQWLGVVAVPDTPLLSMHAKLVAIPLLMFGVAYLLAACRPISDVSFCLIALGAAGKFATFGITLGYAIATDVPWGYVMLTFFDLLYGILFVEYLIWFRCSQPSEP